MKRFFHNLFLFLALAISQIFAEDAQINTSLPHKKIHTLNNKPYHVFMVLWVGEDSLSKGFMDYLSFKKIDVKYTIRNCAEDRKKCHDLVPEIRAAKPDLIFTWGTPVCEEIAGKIDEPKKDEYIWDIPILALIVTDPIKSKIIYDLVKPGRNVTGVNHVAPENAHLETILSYEKSTKKIAALFNPAETNAQIMVDRFLKLADKYQIEIKAFPISLDQNGKPAPQDIISKITQIKQWGGDFIYMPADTFLSQNISTVVKTANSFRIPTFGSTESMFFKGHPLLGLLSKFYDVGQFGGIKAESILLEGKQPHNIPYEKLSHFSLLIAQDVFLDIRKYPPLSMLSYADILMAKNNDLHEAKNG